MVYKKSLQNQEITLKDTIIDPCYYHHDEGLRTVAAVGLIGIGIIMGMVILATVRACDKEPEPVAITQNCSNCHSKAYKKKQAMVAYFANAGSKSPEQMAEACLATKKPRLMAAIAKVETGGNSHVRNTGYKKQHHGAFQVNPRYWGNVPRNATLQALQAEAILQELTETMPIKKALSYYGGDNTNGYQRRILAELVRVP